jgi:hypothetical protein
MSDVDCTGVDDPTCPKCGASWQDDDHVVVQSHGYVTVCEECGASYSVEADFTVDYTSTYLTPVEYTTRAGEPGTGVCDLDSVCYCGPEFMPPDGKARRVFDRHGHDILVPFGSVRPLLLEAVSGDE